MLYTIYIIYILGLLKKTLTMVKTKYLTLIFFLIFFKNVSQVIAVISIKNLLKNTISKPIYKFSRDR